MKTAGVNPFELIATDLDGTFLAADGQIPDINRQAIQLAASRGIATVFATGRPLRWLRVLDELAFERGWVVAANGAVILDVATGQVTGFRGLPTAELGAAVVEIGDRLPQARFAVEYLWGWGAEPAYPIEELDQPPTLRAPVADLLAQDEAVKLLVVDPLTDTEQLAVIVSAIVGERATVTFSHVAAAGMLELSAPGVNKAGALRELLADLGLVASQLIAFGDMPNDLEMLALAGQGFVMNDCHPSLRAAGFRLAGDNSSGGVGRTILRLLGEMPD